MKKYPLLIFLLPCLLFSQTNGDFEKALKYNLFDCDDITYNAFLLLPHYYEAGKTDSAKMLIDFWKNRCESQEISVRTEILHAIYTNQDIDNHYDQNIIRYLYQFKKGLNRDSSDSEALTTNAEKYYSAYRSFDRYLQVFSLMIWPTDNSTRL